jgi:tRNA-specific 2-thiouridylase
VLTARLHQPARGVAAGQAIVAYRTDAAGGDVVLGSATITAGLRSSAADPASHDADPEAQQPVAAEAAR